MNDLRILPDGACAALIDADVLTERVAKMIAAAVIEIEVLRRKESLTAAQVEILFGIPVETLRTLRKKGRGPQHEKVAGRIHYKPEDVRAWKALGARRSLDMDRL